jgi:hypothetical protein
VNRPYARALHGLVAAMVAVGLTLEVVTALTSGPGVAGTMTERFVRLFSYFTIQSNILVGVTSGMLAYPIAWLAYTFVRGAATGCYPYPFLDVNVVGYARAAARRSSVRG